MLVGGGGQDQLLGNGGNDHAFDSSFDGIPVGVNTAYTATDGPVT